MIPNIDFQNVPLAFTKRNLRPCIRRLPFHRFIDFLAMYLDRFRSSNSKTNFVATDIDYRDHNVITDHNRLAILPTQNQHDRFLPEQRIVKPNYLKRITNSR